MGIESSYGTKKIEMTEIGKEVDSLMRSQLIEWQQASENYKALKGVIIKQFALGDIDIKVQFNPARIVSSAAKVDPKSIKERKCFLCKSNRPIVQRGIDYKGVSAEYEILVNPFPIFPRHLTIPDKNHSRQEILQRYSDMLMLARDLDEYVVFYNGPKCGASAPDHCHFQAGNKGVLPIQQQLGKFKLQELPISLAESKLTQSELDNAHLYLVKEYIKGCFLIVSDSLLSQNAIFNKIYSKLTIKEREWEPMLNILCWFNENNWYTALFLREKHRPSCFFADGDSNILLSPASVDLGGLYITPLEKDFNKIGIKEINEINNEIMVSQNNVDTIIKQLI